MPGLGLSCSQDHLIGIGSIDGVGQGMGLQTEAAEVYISCSILSMAQEGAAQSHAGEELHIRAIGIDFHADAGYIAHHGRSRGTAGQHEIHVIAAAVPDLLEVCVPSTGRASVGIRSGPVAL